MKYLLLSLLFVMGCTATRTTPLATRVVEAETLPECDSRIATGEKDFWVFEQGKTDMLYIARLVDKTGDIYMCLKRGVR